MQLSKSDLIRSLPNLQQPIKTRSAVAQEFKKRKLESGQTSGEIDSRMPLAEPMQYEMAMAENVQLPYPYLVPGLSIQQIERYSSQIQSILNALQIEPLKTIPLPKLQVAEFPIDARFPVDEDHDYISIMYRQWMKEFMDHVLAKLSKKRFGSPIALTGPQGIGKSHCLYLLVAILRKEVQRYRVFYLPSCSYLQDAFGFQEVDRGKLADDLIVSFPDQDVRPFIEKFFAHGLDLNGCITALNKYYRSHQIQIVLVLDQYNAINVNVDEGKRVLNLINHISTHIPTVISYSANNNVEIKQEKYDIYNPQNYLVEDNEAVAFCRLFDKQISDIEVEDLVSVVGGVPLELVTCLKYVGTVDERIMSYSAQRCLMFRQSIRKYLSELNEPDLNIALQDIPGIIVRAGQRGSRYLEFDKKLILEKNGASYSYSFINKTALNTVWSYLIAGYPSQLTAQLDNIAKAVISSDRNQSAKGHEVEHYIIMRSCLHRRFVVKQLDIIVENLQIHYFVPSTLTSVAFTGSNAILVPNVANLAGFDFAVYDHDRRRLYLVQVTVEVSAKRHRDNTVMAMTDPGSKLSFWLVTLKHTFGDRQPEYYEIYITKNETGTTDAYNSVSISELAGEYPALSSFE